MSHLEEGMSAPSVDAQEGSSDASTAPVPGAFDEWVVVDFETASGRGTPCQLAAVRFRDGVEVDGFSTYVFQHADHFDGFNIALHGITPAMVADAPPWPSVEQRLLEFAGTAPLVAHYAPFDMGVIRDACQLCTIDWPTLRYTCTVGISRQVWPGLASYSLLLLCSELGIPFDHDRHHEALYDARLAAEVLTRAIQAKEATDLADLLERIWIRFGQIAPDGWYGSHVRSLTASAILPTADPNADPDSPFYGKTVVFTGELAMVRRQAWQLVASLGGQPAANVTAKTNLLVCGYQDMYRLAADETTSHKFRRAEEFHAQGKPIEILTERDFFRLLGSVETSI